VSRRVRARGIAPLLVLALLLTACGQVVTLELPTVDAEARIPDVQSVVYDAAGNQLAVLRREFREPVSLADVPRHVVDAVLTAEDRRFFEHTGVDARAVTRAALANFAAGHVQQGGSTITQQVVKLLYMPDAARDADTKLREAMLARDLERQQSKAEILTDYLNAVYFGEGAYGIEAAAQTYFRVPAAELDVAQAALLAAIIRAPEALTPTRHPEAAEIRRDDVLRRMTEDGRIDAQTRDRALAEPIEVHARLPRPETREPHFVDFVVRTLLQDPRLGGTEEERASRIYGGGLRIHTTLRPELQALARTALLERLPDEADPEAAIVLVEPGTGHVVAAAGNRSHEQLQYDLPTQARRQPGSTFKTFVLATAIAEGRHPETRLDGRQGRVDTGSGSWEVRNYDRRSYPSVTLAGATRLSVNSAFARLGIDVGVHRVAATATAMGVASHVPPDDAQITIGGGALGVTPLDMAAAFATLGNLGTHHETTPVARIEDREGHTVWLPDATPSKVLAPSAAYVTAEVLQDAVERGTGRAARVEGWEVAGKTGTTSDHTDAWFVGTTTALAGAVWMGHVEGRVPMTNVRGVARVTGGSLPASLFSEVMTAALADLEPVPFELPDEEWELVEIDPRTGLRAASWCPGEVERLPRVLVPRETCPEPPPAPDPPPPPPPAPEPEEPEPDEEEEPDDEAEDDDADVDEAPDDEADDGDDPDEDAPEDDEEVDTDPEDEDEAEPAESGDDGDDG
jgi:membrane peptidoglycan carboxypeptidase